MIQREAASCSPPLTILLDEHVSHSHIKEVRFLVAFNLTIVAYTQ